MTETDVVVVGGGPAGSVAATLLADKGHRVVLLERERFPRYHIGESLLSACLPILEQAGALEKIERHGFLKKLGATFCWGPERKPWDFWFRENHDGRPYSFQVIRSEFDKLLLDNAREHGVTVYEETPVTKVVFDGGKPIVYTDRLERPYEARFVIDASGQGAVVGKALRLRRYDDFFKNLAVFSYWTGAKRMTGDRANNILCVSFKDGWFWCIPLHDGTMSVGAVIDVMKYGEEEPQEVYNQLIAACPAIQDCLRDAQQVQPVRVIRDYSYDSTSFSGPGYLLAGDAGCFLDPVFSTGVHLALFAASQGAQTVDSILKGESEAPALARYDQLYRTVYQKYRTFLHGFYTNEDGDYFEKARAILNSPAGVSARQAFIRLVSGASDMPAKPPLTRTWKPDDFAELVPLILAYLEEAKLDFLPTAANAQALFELGLTAVMNHDPALVAVADGKIVGFLLWIPVAARLELREKILSGIGTYVLPAYRRQHISLHLRRAAQKLARKSGYARVDGIALTDEGAASALASGAEKRGTYVSHRL